MKKVIVVLASLFFVNVTFASIEFLSHQVPAESIEFDKGGWSSGGGNGVVCFKDLDVSHSQELRDLLAEKHAPIPNKFLRMISSIETFDYYTAKLARGFDGELPQIMKIKDEETIEEYVDRVSKRFENNVSVISNIIDNTKYFLRPHNIRFHQSPIIQKKDMNALGLLDEERCMFTTLAVQRSDNDYIELHIDARLFNLGAHSRQSRATLYLHEIIYLHARRVLEATDSYATRKLVEEMISKYEEQTAFRISRTLRRLGFVKYNIPFPSDEIINNRYTITSSTIGDTISQAIASILNNMREPYFRVDPTYASIVKGYSLDYDLNYDDNIVKLREICPGVVFNKPEDCFKDLEKLKLLRNRRYDYFKSEFETIMQMFVKFSGADLSYFSKKEIGLLNNLVLEEDSFVSNLFAHASVDDVLTFDDETYFSLNFIYENEGVDYSSFLWLQTHEELITMPNRPIPFVN
ncbi:MAG: hypothetical protein VX341_13400 [Bdellovibrionota bacterium]|nr:hypothetical protein [Bdellovibrionota bacterium]